MRCAMNSVAPFSPSAATDALVAAGTGDAGMVSSAIAGAVAAFTLRIE